MGGERSLGVLGGTDSGTAALNGLNVAVVEDDPFILMALRLVLEGAGCHVLAADSVEAVLAGLGAGESAPSVIVADLRLKGGATGLEAVAAIRRACDSELPAIIVTGDTEPDRVRAVERSGNAVLHKPVAPHVLLAALAQAASARISKPT